MGWFVSRGSDALPSPLITRQNRVSEKVVPMNELDCIVHMLSRRRLVGLSIDVRRHVSPAQ